MRRNMTWKSLPCLIMLGLLLTAGCRSYDAIADVPVSELEFANTAGPSIPFIPSVQPASPSCEPDWQVSGLRPWKYIVVHHSASQSGSSEAFNREHQARGWDEMGYHFVIDNGNGGRDGQVETGSRWMKQKWGAHTGRTPDNEYNNYGIGICLVGNFQDQTPTPAQLASLEKLIDFLSAKYNIAPNCIIGHRDAPNASTECPGDMLENYVRTSLRQHVAERYHGGDSRLAGNMQ